MGLAQNTPIYGATRDFVTHIAEVIAIMPRNFKSALGNDVLKDAARLARLVFHANCAADKTPHLNQLLEELHALEFSLQLLHDLGCFPKEKHKKAIALSASIGKQATSWRNSYAKKSSPAT